MNDKKEKKTYFLFQVEYYFLLWSSNRFLLFLIRNVTTTNAKTILMEKKLSKVSIKFIITTSKTIMDLTNTKQNNSNIKAEANIYKIDCERNI